MNDLLFRLSILLHDDSGQDMVEYALILLFISLASIAAMNGLSNVIAQVPDALMYQFWSLYSS